jgi:hypothetical protein
MRLPHVSAKLLGLSLALAATAATRQLEGFTRPLEQLTMPLELMSNILRCGAKAARIAHVLDQLTSVISVHLPAPGRTVSSATTPTPSALLRPSNGRVPWMPRPKRGLSSSV